MPACEIARGQVILVQNRARLVVWTEPNIDVPGNVLLHWEDGTLEVSDDDLVPVKEIRDDL